MSHLPITPLNFLNFFIWSDKAEVKLKMSAVITNISTLTCLKLRNWANSSRPFISLNNNHHNHNNTSYDVIWMSSHCHFWTRWYGQEDQEANDHLWYAALESGCRPLIPSKGTRGCGLIGVDDCVQLGSVWQAMYSKYGTAPAGSHEWRVNYEREGWEPKGIERKENSRKGTGVEEKAPAWPVPVSERGFKRWSTFALDEEGET